MLLKNALQSTNILNPLSGNCSSVVYPRFTWLWHTVDNLKFVEACLNWLSCVVQQPGEFENSECRSDIVCSYYTVQCFFSYIKGKVSVIKIFG